uniref:Uncharacterized protein n=1 Tax=Panagrolaimus sp. PS1159 TaxID=55785 RepID=A0AC35FJF5_9BILA
MSSAQMPIILLRDGTENRQGRGKVMNNINAYINVSDYVRTSLGPRGMDKLVNNFLPGQHVVLQVKKFIFRKKNVDTV